MLFSLRPSQLIVLANQLEYWAGSDAGMVDREKESKVPSPMGLWLNAAREEGCWGPVCRILADRLRDDAIRRRNQRVGSVYLLLVLAIAWGALLVMVHHFTPILKSIYEIRGVQVAPLVQGLDQIQQWSFLWGPGIPVVALLTYLVSRRWGAKIRKESHATKVLSWALAEALANHRTPREALGIAGRVFGVRPEQLQIGGQGIVSMEQLSSSTQQEIISVAYWVQRRYAREWQGREEVLAFGILLGATAVVVVVYLCIGVLPAIWLLQGLMEQLR